MGLENWDNWENWERDGSVIIDGKCDEITTLTAGASSSIDLPETDYANRRKRKIAEALFARESLA